ncbi:MAG: HAD family hydrolase [Sphaerochaetaceae bacterium]
MPYTTVLFDLDGTLMDTSRGISVTVNYVMEQLGREKIPSRQLRSFMGPPLPMCFKAACGLEDDLIDRACAIYRATYPKIGVFQAEVYAGMKPLLSTLKAKGCKLGVATLKIEDIANEILSRFGLSPYFEAIIGADREGARCKADIIRLGLERMGVQRASALMVGDTLMDLQGACEAGVDFAGVDYGFGFNTGETLAHREGVVGMVSNPMDLLPLILG